MFYCKVEAVKDFIRWLVALPPPIKDFVRAKKGWGSGISMTNQYQLLIPVKTSLFFPAQILLHSLTMAAPANPSLLTRYLTELAAHPLRTKAITSSVLAALQEFTAQKLSGTKSTSSGPIDKRVVQMALYGKNLAPFISFPTTAYG